MVNGKLVATILAVGILLLLARVLSAGEPVAYVVASLLGLLALMVRTIFDRPMDHEA